MNLKEIHEISSTAMLKALIRENFILKAQFGLLHDTLIEKGMIGENELHPKLKQFLADFDEDDYTRYIIETAHQFNSEQSNSVKN